MKENWKSVISPAITSKDCVLVLHSSRGLVDLYADSLTSLEAMGESAFYSMRDWIQAVPVKVSLFAIGADEAKLRCSHFVGDDVEVHFTLKEENNWLDQRNI